MIRQSEFLDDVDYDKALKLNGGFVHNYKELLESVLYMSASKLKDNKVDILEWLEENYGDSKLVDKLKSTRSKKHFESALRYRINSLKKEPKELSNKFIAAMAVALIVISVLGFIYADAKIDLARAQNKVDVLETNIVTLERDIKSIVAYQDNMSSLQKALSEALSDASLLSEKNEELSNLLEAYTMRRSSSDIDPPIIRLEDEDIEVFEDSIKVLMPNLRVAKIAHTGSMNPVLTEDAHTIEILPKSYGDIKKGDIISYEYEDQIIIHRVSFTSFDADGWYAKTRGDSNDVEDPYKVRFSDIAGLVIGILY